MKALNIKLATFSFAALLLASCSDSNSDAPNNNNGEKSIVGKEVVSITNAEELAARVINYNTNFSTRARTRANISEPQVTQLTMPAAPTANGTTVNGNIDKPGDYIVKSNVSITLGNISNTNIYVTNEGELTITNHWGIGENVNIYVLNGGKLHNQSGNLDYNIYVYGDATFDSNKASIYIQANKGLYIEGDWTTSTDIDNRGNFYIGGNYNGSKFAPGWGSNSTFKGSLTLENEFQTAGSVYIGKNLKAQNLEFGSEVYIGGNVDISNNVYKTTTSNANVYIGGDLKCGDFYNNQGSTTNVQGENGLDLSKKDITINGTVNFAGAFKANTLTLAGTTDFYACGIVTKGLFKIDSNSAKAHVNYIEAPNIYQCADSHILLADHGYINCTGTYENQNNGVGSIDLVGTNASGLFKANKVKYNGSNDYDLGNNQRFSICRLFNAESEGSNIYLAVKEFENNGITLTDFSKVPRGGRNANWEDVSQDYNVTATKCGYSVVPKGEDNNPSEPTKPSKPTEPGGKKLTPISDIIYDHDHDISATCIQPYNGKLYMSYHTNVENQEDKTNTHGGCIEVFQTQNDQTTLLQFLQDKEKAIDFNHLMIDSEDATKQVYVVGNSSKVGGMFARIDLDGNGYLNTDVKDIDETTAIYPLTVVPLIRNLKKGDPQGKNDENCIVRDGNKLLIMSTRGYEVYDPETLKSLGNKATDGKAKHIAKSGNKIATLYYNERPSSDETAVSGTVEIYNTGADILSGNPSQKINVESIAPNDGKNTIAIDGNNVYVCRSGKGLSCYDINSGNEVWNWSAPLTANTKVPQGYANGVTFDSNYIYLACGSYGLVVLDKNKTEDGKPVIVAKKRCATTNSANYVTVDNGLIYVAYGKSRLQVFKLIDK